MTGCVEHRQKGTSIGYAKARYQGRQATMHRIVYCKSTGTNLADIVGEVVRHTCDNPRCINPEHLIIGTHQDNINDKVRRNRQAKGEVHGMAVLTAENVRFIRKHYKPRCELYSGRKLAQKYNVTPAAISLVIKGKKWAHV